MVAAVADVRSACKPVFEPSNMKGLLKSDPVAFITPNRSPGLIKFNDPFVGAFPLTGLNFGEVEFEMTGAEEPIGKLTAEPFCGHGRAEVK